MGSSIRPSGLDHATAALRNIERQQAIVANNLANVSTAGFKGELAFAHLLDAGSTATMGSSTDMRSGTLNTTGNPLDLAIEKEGFLVVQTGAGERWTRAGSLQINDAGYLVDSNGNQILGEEDEHGGTRGPVLLSKDVRELKIDKGGAVFADGNQVARLRIERPMSGVHIEHEGYGLFKPAAEMERMIVADRTVKQGALEESNVQSLPSMVDLIEVQRAYASVMKVITTIDNVANIAASQIGKPA